VTPNRVATEKLYVPHTAFGLKPNPSYVDRGDEQRAIAGAVPKLLESYAPSGSYSERCYLDDITWWLYLAGFTPSRPPAARPSPTPTRRPRPASTR
jgi:hypothetical protein